MKILGSLIPALGQGEEKIFFCEKCNEDQKHVQVSLVDFNKEVSVPWKIAARLIMDWNPINGVFYGPLFKCRVCEDFLFKQGIISDFANSRRTGR